MRTAASTSIGTAPAPEPPLELTRREWWYGIKGRRQLLLRPLPLTDAAVEPFAYSTPGRKHVFDAAPSLAERLGQAR